MKDPNAKSTIRLQQNNKFYALANIEKHIPLNTSNINTMREQIRTDQRSLLGAPTEKKEVMDFGRCIASREEQESPNRPDN